MGTKRNRLISRKNMERFIPREYLDMKPKDRLYVNVVIGNIMVWLWLLYALVSDVIGFGIPLSPIIKAVFGLCGVGIIILEYSRSISLSQFEIYRKYISRIDIWLYTYQKRGDVGYKIVGIDPNFLRICERDNIITINIDELIEYYPNILGVDSIISMLEMANTWSAYYQNQPILEDSIDRILYNSIENYSDKEIRITRDEEIYRINNREKVLDNILS